ncbi:MAG: hypothetical protein MPJ53_00790 [Alphaproteobacteria bacterium]|nr:hypothetical protein [Alphaproteobacteria bacterium]
MWSQRIYPAADRLYGWATFRVDESVIAAARVVVEDEETDKADESADTTEDETQ